MSGTVHFKGFLTEVEKLEGETLQKQCARLLDYPKKPSYFDSYEEMLLDKHYQEFVVNDGVLYMVSKEEIDDYDDIFRIKKTDEKTFEFEVKYYNGGCSFDEAIDYAFDNK